MSVNKLSLAFQKHKGDNKDAICSVAYTQQVRRKRWKWIDHVLRMPSAALPRVALRWTPDGRRKRGRPKETWRRTVEKEMKENSWTWGHLERRAPDRSQWHTLTEALCVSKHEED